LILPNSSKRRLRHIFVALLETALLKAFTHCSRSSAGFLKRIARLRHFHLFNSVRHENGGFLSLNLRAIKTPFCSFSTRGLLDAGSAVLH
jgi:hypothetical protein